MPDEGASIEHIDRRQRESVVLIGYARVSTTKQDAQSQRDALLAAGVDAERIYVDAGRSGRTTAGRIGLERALAAARHGDTIVVTKLDRLARSIRDFHDLADAITAKGVTLQIDGQAYEPSSPMGRMFFSLLATFAEFESDLIRARTKEGMAIAKAKGRLRGRSPKLKPAQEAHALALVDAGEQSMGEIAELFGVSRATLYRAKERRDAKQLASVEAILPGLVDDRSAALANS